jgi:hypothetical protein
MLTFQTPQENTIYLTQKPLSMIVWQVVDWFSRESKGFAQSQILNKLAKHLAEKNIVYLPTAYKRCFLA